MRNYLRVLLSAVFLWLCTATFAQIPLPSNTIVSENFSSLGSLASAPLPLGWRLSPAGNAPGDWSAGLTTTTQAANSGMPAAGGRYNWGTAAGTDRALGFLTDGAYNAPNAVMVHYRNATGAAVNSVTVAFFVKRFVQNTGSFSLSFESSTDGSTWTSQPGGDIAPGLFAGSAAAADFSNPLSLSRTLQVNVTVPANGDVYFRWVFNTTNTASQGLGLDNVSVFAGNATPVLTAKLQAILQQDNGTQNQFNEGDVIRYRTVIKNIGSGDASNVQLTIPPPANTTLVTGSIKTSAVAVDDQYVIPFGASLSGASVLANDFGMPAPTAVLSFGTTENATLYAPGAEGTTDAGGTILVNTDGTFSYTPPVGFSGEDKFAYITGNGNLPNNDAIVSITVIQPVSFTNTTVDPACNNGTNGSITILGTGGSGALQYSIDNGGSFQESNKFTGLAAGNYQIVVKDAAGQQKTGTVTLNNPAAIVVSGSIPQLTYGTAMTTAAFTHTNGAGTPANPWSATGLPAGISLNSATGSITGTPVQTGSFNASVIYTDANGCSGTNGLTIVVAPNVQPETYTTVGNTQLKGGGAAPATPTVTAVSVAVNDQSDAALTYALVSGPSQGAITVNADGSFLYTPAAGNTSGTAFTYSATSNGVTVNQTATINFSGKVLYVQAGGAAGDGRSNTPYNSLPSGNLGSTGDLIYVLKETGAATTTPGGLTLQANQQLIGAGATLNVPSASPVLTISGNAANYPTLAGTVTLASNATVTGIDMSTGSNTALTGSGATNVNVSARNVSTSGAATALSLTNLTGTITVSGGTLTGGAGATVNINGGSANVTYGGVVNQTTSNQKAITIAGATGGTITFGGAVNATGSSAGVALTSNTGATINFTGPIKLDGLASVFSATGGGTITATDANNTIGATTAPNQIALNVTSTTIGGSGLKFKSISANGGSNGIYLSNTGTAGGLQVTGDGSNWGSGGTIQNTTGADGAIAGNGIYLNNSSNASFNFMYLNGHQNNAIFGSAVRGFTLSKTRVTGLNGTSNSGTYDESPVHLVDIGGAVSIKNSYFSGGAYNTIILENITGTNAAITSLQMDSDTLTGMQGSTADVRSTALLVNLSDGTMSNATIQNCRIDSWWGNAIHVLSQGTASATVSILNNYCNNTNGALAGAGGIWVAGGNLNYTITGNNVQNTNGTAISADRVGAGSLMKGAISGNTIGTSGLLNSGSGTGIAIFASHHGPGTTTTTINNNVIRQVNGSASGAITVLTGDDASFGGSGFLNATVQGNNIQESGSLPNSAQQAILFTIGITSTPTPDAVTACLNIGGPGAQANVITNFNTTSTRLNGIRVNQRFGTSSRFPGYTGATTGTQSATDLTSYLLGRNTASTSVNSNSSTGGFQNTAGGVPCTQ